MPIRWVLGFQGLLSLIPLFRLSKHQNSLQFTQPKFLTKEERARIALEKRQKEVEEQRRAQDEERQQREEFLKKADEERSEHSWRGSTFGQSSFTFPSSSIEQRYGQGPMRGGGGRNDGFGRPSGYGGGDRGPSRDGPSDLKKPRNGDVDGDVNEAELQAIRVSLGVWLVLRRTASNGHDLPPLKNNRTVTWAPPKRSAKSGS